MRDLYNPEALNQESSETEIYREDKKEDFVSILAVELMKILNINHNDRRVFVPIMISAIDSLLNKRSDVEPGLLQQYERYIIDKAAERFYTDLNVPKDIGINYNYAEHARFADIVRYLQKQISEGKK